jgi:transposase-like protein
MISKLSIKTFEQAAQRFTAAEAEALKDWHPFCNCLNPGGELECETCPHFKILVQLIQQKLHPIPAEIFPVILPTEIKPPYSDEVKQQCVELHTQGYSLETIQWLTGVTNCRRLREWIRQANRLDRAVELTPELRQRCLLLNADGMSASQIEDLTGVPTNLVNNWLKEAGLFKPRLFYSTAQKQQALALYREGRDLGEIETLTGVLASSVRSMANRANLSQPKRVKMGRSRIHSPEVRQSCRNLLREGKSPVQIEELLGVSANTIRDWKKQWEKAEQVLSPENEPNNPDEGSGLS